MLGENCAVITPTRKDSSMSFTEQSATPSKNQNPTQPDPSAEILLCVESLQQPSAPTKDVVGGDRSGEVSDSDSGSGLDSKSCSDSDSHNEFDSGSEDSSEKSPSRPSKETSSEIPKDQANLGKPSPQEPDPNVPPKNGQISTSSLNSINNQKTDTTTKKRTTDTNQ